MLKILNHGGYRSVIASVLAERQARNPRYSLRAIARDLGLSSSRVTEILNGKDGLSARSAKAISERLHFDECETERFVTMVAAESARKGSERLAAQAKLRFLDPSPEERLIREDHIEAIKNWHHLAILELMRMPDARSDSAWVAQQMKISPSQADAALARLVRLGLLSTEGGDLRPTSKRFVTTVDIPSRRIREFHKDILTEALRALDDQDVGQREFGSSFFLLEEESMQVIKEEIRRLRSALVKKHEVQGAKTRCTTRQRAKKRVYCLSTHLFRISQ